MMALRLQWKARWSRRPWAVTVIMRGGLHHVGAHRTGWLESEQLQPCCPFPLIASCLVGVSESARPVARGTSRDYLDRRDSMLEWRRRWPPPLTCTCAGATRSFLTVSWPSSKPCLSTKAIHRRAAAAAKIPSDAMAPKSSRTSHQLGDREQINRGAGYGLQRDDALMTQSAPVPGSAAHTRRARPMARPECGVESEWNPG